MEVKARNFLDNLYNDIGKKIKKFAKGCFWVELCLLALAAVLFWFATMGVGIGAFLLATLLAPIGVVIGGAFFYVASWPIYWAGEMLEKVCKIEENSRVSHPSEESENGAKLPKTDTSQKTGKTETQQVPQQSNAKKELRYCPNCGVEVVFDDTECAFCGAKLN